MWFRSPRFVGAHRSGMTADQLAVSAFNSFDSANVGRDAWRLGSPDAETGTGSVAIASVWLALYVVAILTG
jgi:hypothetical protein